jgi:hypothetical protein
MRSRWGQVYHDLYSRVRQQFVDPAYSGNPLLLSHSPSLLKVMIGAGDQFQPGQ